MISKKERLFSTAVMLNCLICPVCGERLERQQDCFRCVQGHTINVNKKGFLNVLSRQTDGCYDESLFLSRQQVFQSGCYLPVLDEIIRLLPSFPCKILDAGCGEGWWLNQILSRRNDCTGTGIDISRDAIHRATDWPCEGLWMVGDLRHLPFGSQSFDVILDVLTPASYSEFRRLLKPNGILIKIYPEEQYLREIREARGMTLYQAGQVDAYLHENARVLSSVRVTSTIPVTPDLWSHFVRMTPLNQDMSSEDLDRLAASPLSTITIDLSVTAAQL